MQSNSEIIFLGTGTSEGVPRVTCLTNPDSTCPVCPDAVKPGSKNRRRNTSLVIRYAHPDGRVRNILIDAGKFFYQSAIEWFPKYDVQTIDAVILTHAHADAAHGLDDLRDWTNNGHADIPIYLRDVDLEVVSKSSFYLVDMSKATGGGGVARLTFTLIDERPLEVEGLTFTPLPVLHGRNSTAFGFRFGEVCYVSDSSEIPSATRDLMAGCELLVLDALRPERTHGSHFTLEEAVEHARLLKPGRTLLTDMAHDIDHEPVDAWLRSLKASEGLDIGLSYDGLCLTVEL